MKTLAIIPAFNEENSIDSVIRSIKRHQPSMDIVVVNDGSSDRTGAVARSTGLAQVIDLPVNLGIGGAVQTGYLYAFRKGYDIAVQIDADGQHDPSELSKLIQALEDGEADCCTGSRFIDSLGYRSTFTRRMGILFFTWMIHWMTGRRITDPTSGFRAVNREGIRLFADYYPDDYPEVEALVLLIRSGYRVMEKPVRMEARTAGKSSITPFKSLYYMLKVSLAVVMTRMREAGKV